ncbi:MAG: T9SS type A sorting domain-containing protein [Bacteriodetes bacterium]|nr:T9SS type A sorting domain-containing protein [Bacteroidota bacterium]
MKLRFVFCWAILLCLTNILLCAGGTEDTVWTRRLKSPISFITFSPKGNVIAVVSDTTTYLYDKNGMVISSNIPSPTGPLTSFNNKVFFVQNEENILMLHDSVIQIYSTQTGDLVQSFDIDTTLIRIEGISSDEQYCLTIQSRSGGMFDSQIGWKIWDMKTGKVLKYKEYNEPLPNVRKVSPYMGTFLCSGNKVAIKEFKYYNSPPGTSTTYTVIYDVETLTPLDTIQEEEKSWKFTMSPQCTYIAYNLQRNDTGIKIYNVATKKLVRSLRCNGNSASTIAFTNDDQYIIVGNVGTNTIDVTKVSTGENVWHLEGTTPQGISITSDNYLALFVSYHLDLYKPNFLTSVSDISHQTINTVIYPNPAIKDLQLGVEIVSPSSVKIEIISLIGVVVYQTETPLLNSGNQTITIPLESVANGEYLLKVNAGTKSITYKLIINK